MISAIVLAAGQATRFGECKQLVRLGGKTLLEHALASVRGAKIDDVVVVLGDQPFVASATLDALIDEYRRTNASVIIPTYRGLRGNPVLVDRSLFAEMMNIRGDIGCRAIFGDHADSIVNVPVEDRGVVVDIDTVEDLAG